MVTATKAALVALSTGLRMELAASGVDVIMVAPGSTDTPFFDTAANVDARASGLVRMKYPPQRVARAVVRASRRRRREVVLTAPAKAIILIQRGSRRLADAIMYKIARRAMPVVEPPAGPGDTDRA